MCVCVCVCVCVYVCDEGREVGEVKVLNVPYYIQQTHSIHMNRNINIHIHNTHMPTHTYVRT